MDFARGSDLQPALSRVSRSIRNESLKIFYQRTRFFSGSYPICMDSSLRRHVSPHETMIKWLKHIGPVHRGNIKNLTSMFGSVLERCSDALYENSLDDPDSWWPAAGYKSCDPKVCFNAKWDGFCPLPELRSMGARIRQHERSSVMLITFPQGKD